MSRRKMRWVADWWPLVVLLIAAALLFGLYSSWFGRSLSEQHSNWGEFGDLMGGVLNPIVGVITVVLVITGLRLQAQEFRKSSIQLKRAADASSDQLEEIRRSARRDVLLKQADKVFNEINMAFKKEFAPEHAFYTNAFDLDVLNDLADPLIGGKRLRLEQIMHPKWFRVRLNSEHANAGGLKKWAKEIERLCVELGRYLSKVDLSLDGERDATDYYRRRLSIRLTRMHAAGYFPAHLLPDFLAAPDALAKA